jgi:DNA-binding NarL/FixJ family response regulator
MPTPLNDAAARPVRGGIGSSHAPLVRVLVADDSDTFLRAAAQVIAVCSGFELTAMASTGEEAIALSEQLHPDLVLLDVRMPGMGGIAAAEEITAGDPGVQVVLISGGPREDAPGMATSSLPYLSKSSFGPETLRTLWLGADAD